jgi:tetraacyldisaccharide 4'-kinase
VILTLSSSIFGAASSWRRRWYTRDPTRRSRLAQPVVSVGNLRVGGSGKTPVVESLARLLVSQGEHPVILSRGYGRRRPAEGVTVVSDRSRIVSDLDAAGDEPLMLARSLPGVPVLVGADRFLSGRLAERKLGATVHLLDDGFQHLSLARDVDLLLLDESDLTDRVVPLGRLREPLTAATCADAVLAPAAGDAALDRFRRLVGSGTVWEVRRALGPVRWLGDGGSAALDRSERVFAVAGIARPERFFGDLQAAGWTLVGTMIFRDHHRYRATDTERIAAAARASGAAAVLTTEKDAVRLENVLPQDVSVAVVPLTASIEPPRFTEWLCDRLRLARSRRTEQGAGLDSDSRQPQTVEQNGGAFGS